jgi:hypothetical protein
LRKFTLLLLAVSGSLAADPRGLIDQPQTFPWTVGLTPVAAEEAGGLDEGAVRWRSSVLWFNTYRQYGRDPDREQTVDQEGLLETVSGAWSPVDGWELRAQLQGWALGGGFMDYFLSGFHGVLAVPNQGRDYSPENDYRDYLKGSFDDRSPAAGLTQASLGVRWFSGPWSWSVWAKPPVGDHVGWGWSGRWGAGTSAGWGGHWDWPEAGVRLGAGLTAALVWADPDNRLPNSEGWATGQAAGYVSVEGNNAWRALVQGSWTKVPRGGEGYLPQGAGLLTMGFQSPLSQGWSWEGALTEEFFTWATMEVGFQVGAVLLLN